MIVAKVQGVRYTVDPLYQWDLNQVLEIRGLSLPSKPEIHFTNGSVDVALIPETNMDDAGVITAAIPNSLLQSASQITAYVCIWEGETFRSLYNIVIPVKGRVKPSDYVYTETEILRYEYLENRTLTDAEIELLNTILVDGTAISQPKMTATYVMGTESEPDPETGMLWNFCNVTATVTNIDKVFIQKAEVGWYVDTASLVDVIEWHDAEITFGDTEHIVSCENRSQLFMSFRGLVVKLTYYSLIGGINELIVEAVKR